MLFIALALAQEEGRPELLTDPASIDLDDETAIGSLNYDGSLNGRAAGYVVGKPVTVTHSGGNLSIRCIDSDRLSANLQYMITGSDAAPMEYLGKGIGLSVFGDAKTGSIKTRIPSKTSGVSTVDVPLTVSVPRGVTALTVNHGGRGWVQVLDCTGKVAVSAGRGGLYVSGALASVSAMASGGDAKVVMAPDAVLTGTSAVTAPGGNATLQLSGAQGGKLTAKGAEVSVQQVVMGTNTPTLVQGEMGVQGPSITVTAKNRAEVLPN